MESINQNIEEDDQAKFEWKNWQTEKPDIIGKLFVIHSEDKELEKICSIIEIEGKLKLYDYSKHDLEEDWDGNDKIGKYTITEWCYLIEGIPFKMKNKFI